MLKYNIGVLSNSLYAKLILAIPFFLRTVHFTINNKEVPPCLFDEILVSIDTENYHFPTDDCRRSNRLYIVISIL